MDHNYSRLFIAYFDKQYNLGYVYRFDHQMPQYGEYLYRSPAVKGISNYYYMVPVMEQYLNWLKNIITRWDWGRSKTFQPTNASMILKPRMLFISPIPPLSSNSTA